MCTYARLRVRTHYARLLMHKWSSPPSQTIDLCPQQILYHQTSTLARLRQRIFATTLIWEKIEQAIDVPRSFGGCCMQEQFSCDINALSLFFILQIQYIPSDLMTMMCKSMIFRESFRLIIVSAKLKTKSKLQIVINLFVNFIHYFGGDIYGHDNDTDRH